MFFDREHVLTRDVVWRVMLLAEEEYGWIKKVIKLETKRF